MSDRPSEFGLYQGLRRLSINVADLVVEEGLACAQHTRGPPLREAIQALEGLVPLPTHREVQHLGFGNFMSQN